jgi:5,5'-dehydrodivanillate O-demethylase oxygenase subunit
MTVAPATLDVDVVHTGPDTLAGQYLRRFWTPVSRLDDVAPGRIKPITILNENFTFYRGESGEPHLVGYYCAHRSTQMSTGWVEGEAIRCFYHGWKYDGTGQCIEQPAEFDSYAAKVRIEGYPTRVYLGFVYAYLGPGEPPPFPRLAALEQPGLLQPRAFTRRSNYWNGLENSCDQIHVNFVHRNSEFTAAGASREIPKIDAYETEYGIRRDVSFSDGALRIGYTLMPTASLVTVYDPDAGWMTHLSYRIPVDDESHVSFTASLAHVEGERLQRFLDVRKERARRVAALPPQEEIVEGVVRGDVYLHDMMRPDIVPIQDDVALRAQPSLDRRRPDRLGRSDIQIIVLRKIWSRELRALAAGELLKTWTIPDDLVATTG